MTMLLAVRLLQPVPLPDGLCIRRIPGKPDEALWERHILRNQKWRVERFCHDLRVFCRDVLWMFFSLELPLLILLRQFNVGQSF